VGPVTRRYFEGFERQILSPAFAIELGEHARDTFVAKIDKEAEEVVDPISEQDIERGDELHGGRAHLNRAFSQMGLSYRCHMVRPKRQQKTLTRGPAQSQTSMETPSTCFGWCWHGECSKVFAADLVETCDLVGSAHDDMAQTVEDSADLVTGGKLGKDLIPMKVCTSSMSWWVVCEATAACGCDDVELARMARELLIFPYSHNILSVIAAAMDPKGKAPADLRSGQHEGPGMEAKAISAGLLDSRRSSKVAKACKIPPLSRVHI
jgi:hypothetical protein